MDDDRAPRRGTPRDPATVPEAYTESPGVLEALSIARIGTWEADYETGRQWWSPSTYRVLGVSRDFDTSNDGVIARIHPDDVERVRVHLDHYIARQQDNEIEYRFIADDGSIRHLYVTAHFRADERGEITGVFGIMQDITERVDMEQELRGALQTLSLAQRVGRMGSWLRDAEAGTTRCSEELLRLIGVAADDGEFPGLLYARVHADDRRAVRSAFEAAARPGAELSVEFRLVGAQGDGRGEDDERWLRASARWLRDAEPPAPQVQLGTLQDISDEKRIEAERRLLASRVEHAQKLESLGVLAGGIAHDFNNLLVAILGNASLGLADEATAPETRPVLEEIREGAARAAELAQQMLAYSGRGNFLVERSDLSEIVRGMSQLLEVSISRKAVLERDLDDALPAVEIDRTQVRQVVMNLITNASDAIGEAAGSIRLVTGARHFSADDLAGTWLDDELTPGRFAFVRVVDTGCGMSEDVVSRMFDPFYTTKFTGRGLGLAAVLGIVRSHGGAIDVHSVPGGGTTMTVLFPVVSGAAAAPRRALADRGDWRHDGTVLLVDDEPAVLKVGARMLERLGFEVVRAADGREALERFGAEPQRWCCAIVDLTMPGLDGVEVLRAVRALRADVPVLICSGYSEQDLQARFTESQPSGYLPKPFTLTAMRRALQRVLDSADGSEPEGSPPRGASG